MNSDANPDLQKDLSAALVKLKDVQRQAQAICGPQALSIDEDLSGFLLNLIDRVSHLETELSAVSDLLHHQEASYARLNAEVNRLSHRLLALEDEGEKPIVLQVVKKKRSVGKKTQSD